MRKERPFLFWTKRELTIHRRKFRAGEEIPVDENSLILEQIIANFITAIQRVGLKMYCVLVPSYLLY